MSLGDYFARRVTIPLPLINETSKRGSIWVAAPRARTYGKVVRADIPQVSESSPVDLNGPQAEAVAHVHGPLLVFAGAGSGKTRVITYRVANLVAREGVPPWRILAVTFTNKAASEMRTRLVRLLGTDLAKDLWVGTFHATCARLLRRYGEAIGLSKNFVIYDTDDQKALVTRILAELGLEEKRYPPRACLARIHDAKQALRDPDAMERRSYVDDVVVKVYRHYEDKLTKANAVDFEDLIGKSVRLLEENPGGAGDQIRNRYSHVLVDEFQDTNAAQYRLLRSLTLSHRNLCVVGDDDQSIYKWRGADVRNIRGFREDFPEAQVVKLEQNYRSTGRIVRAALGVIEKSQERVSKALWTNNPEGAPVEIVAAADERDEAAHVVEVIQEARARGIDPKEIAIFYRVHAQSRVLEEALRAVNVPYQIIGGTRFYERAEVKNAIAYLRVLVNPRSDVDLLRVINTPARGIGRSTVERLANFASGRGLSLYQAMEVFESFEEDSSEHDKLASKRTGTVSARKRIGVFRDLLMRLREAAQKRGPSETLVTVLEESGYLEALRSENTAEADARIENLRELLSSVGDYEVEAAAAGEPATLEGYLERVTLATDVDGMKDAARITLMTVHGAKGLEFELVLLTGMEEDMLPYRGMRSMEDHDLEEERRLAYVAITRARSRLVLTHVASRQIFGMTRLGRPSHFLSAIPEDAAVHRATRRRAPTLPRYVDRDQSSYRSPVGGRWRHPVTHSDGAVRLSPERPGERFVDREYFDDASSDDEASLPVRRGSRVAHAQFGEGEVRAIEGGTEPKLLVFFPGRGEKKVLARFLRRV
jgi:DNA helicase II / ATP-dependent DNA helicase PcrA